MMGEIQDVPNHHVKVDNWPLFFLQRLHHFYRKKAHCDLTLLFPSLDSVKFIKVHKLVLHACTDYFETLDIKKDSEHGEVLELSNEMHPDVIIPIISFMYTGKLEFPVALQSQLYEAATKLRMTILTKLLDVHPPKVNTNALVVNDKLDPVTVDTVEEISQISTQSTAPPVSLNESRGMLKPTPTVQPKPVVQTPDPLAVTNPPVPKPRKTLSSPVALITRPKALDDFPPPLPGRRLPIWKRKLPTPVLEKLPNPRDLSLNFPPVPTRFEWDEDLSDPTIIRPVEEATKVLSHDQPARISHPLILDNGISERRDILDESMKRSFSDGSSSDSPPYKRSKSDLQDMKEYGKQQQLRNEIICSEENLDDAMDGDDLYGTCDDSPDETEEVSSFSPLNANSSTPKPILKTMMKSELQMSKRVRFSLDGKENNQQKKDSSGADFTALKMSESNVTSQKIVVPISEMESGKQHVKIVSEVLKKYPNLAKKDNIKLKVVSKNPAVPDTMHVGAKGEGGTGSQTSPLVSYIFFTNRTSGDLMRTKSQEAIPKFDVENKTGPWLCHVCNSNKPLQFDSYYDYRKHLVQVHEMRIDARICEYCGLKNSKRNHFLYHLYTKHGIEPPPSISFPKCNECDYVALSDALLTKHKVCHDTQGLTCFTCNVVFKTYSSIQLHMRSAWHKSKLEMKNKEKEDTATVMDVPCPFCSAKFDNRTQLKQHFEAIHQPQMTAAKLKKQTYRCPYCDDSFHDGEVLGKHIVSRHWGKKTPVSNEEEKAGKNSEQSGQQLRKQGTEGKPGVIETVEIQPSSESEALTNVASGIATSLGLTESEQTVVFFEEREDGDEDQEIAGEATIISEGDGKEYIVINPIEVEEDSRENAEITEEVETIHIINEDSNSKSPNPEISSTSGPDQVYSESQDDDSQPEVISVQEVEGSEGAVIQQILPDQGLVFANEGEVVFDSCVGIPQKLILTSGKLVLPEDPSAQEGVILSQVLPETRIIIGPGLPEGVIEEGSTIVFASSENGEAIEAIEGTVQYATESSEEVLKEVEEAVGEGEEIEKETVFVLTSSEPDEAENSDKGNQEQGREEERVEVMEEQTERNEKTVAEEEKEATQANQSVIETVNTVSESSEKVIEGEEKEKLDKSEEISKTKEQAVVPDKGPSNEPSMEERMEEVVEVPPSPKSNKVEKEKEKEKTDKTTIEEKEKEPEPEKQKEQVPEKEKEQKQEPEKEQEPQPEQEIEKEQEPEKEKESEQEKGKGQDPELEKEQEKEKGKEPEQEIKEKTNKKPVEKEEKKKSVKSPTETKTTETEKKKEEKKTIGNRVETSQIVEDWDETNDSQPRIESRTDGPSRPEFF